jgi:hypothetical protein
MNTAEKKLELFRKIDGLDENELNSVYNQLLSLLSSCKYQLSDKESNAVEKALQTRNDTCSYESIVKEAEQKYPNLKFK